MELRRPAGHSILEHSVDDPFRPPPPPAPAPVPPKPPLAWALPLSGVIHLFGVAFALTLMFRDCRIVWAVLSGPSGTDGENGHSGSGGTEVDFALEPPPAERIGAGQTGTPQPPEAPTPPAAPIVTPTTAPAHAPPRAQVRAPTPTAADPAPPEAPRPAPAAPRDVANAHATSGSTDTAPPVAAPPPIPGAPGGGTMEWFRNSGLRPGSIGQQRALLPRAVHCNDEIAGVWRAQKYDPAYGDWMLATMHIHRGEGTSLHGTIVVHQWDGGPFAIRPPLCGPDGFDFIVDQPGEGFSRDRYLDFGARSWRLREMRCNGNVRLIQYRPDHFTGTVDPAREEFQSVNNDGGRAVNDPMVFRRIACIDEPARPAAGTADAGRGTTPTAPAAGDEPSTESSGSPSPR